MRPALTLFAALVTTLAVAQASGSTVSAADYPAKDAGYHSYGEMATHIRQVATANPGIVRLFSLGKSYQGRKLWAAEVSDDPGADDGEPEVLFDGLHHAREHLSAEMPIYILDLLTEHYGKPTALGKRITKLVDHRRIWIVFMVNPDGLQHDLTGSRIARGVAIDSPRRERPRWAPTSIATTGTDLAAAAALQANRGHGTTADPAPGRHPRRAPSATSSRLV